MSIVPDRDDGARPPSNGGEAAFFDLDKTIIAKAAMAAFRGPLYEGGLLTKRALVRLLLARIVYLHLGASDLRLTRMGDALQRMTRGWNRTEVTEIVDEALERIIDPIIYAEAMDLIELHQALGRRVIIVSASPEEIVEPLARHLGVKETIASRAAVDDADRYTGAIEFYAHGPYKATAVRELAERSGIDLAASFAYSDSFTDLPLLELVGHPVVVNPDRVLAQLARDRGWEVRHFVRPVRLRDRLRDRVQSAQRPTVALSAGVLALAIAALALSWWLGSRHRRRSEAIRALAREVRSLSARVDAARRFRRSRPAGRG